MEEPFQLKANALEKIGKVLEVDGVFNTALRKKHTPETNMWDNKSGRFKIEKISGRNIIYMQILTPVKRRGWEMF